MRRLAPLLLLCAVLHGTNGEPVRINPDQVVGIKRAGKEHEGPFTMVQTVIVPFWVQETPEQVAAALAAATECK